MKKLLFFVFMIAIGTLKACDNVDLDLEILKKAKDKASILDNASSSTEICKLEEEFNIKINSYDQLIKDDFLAEQCGWSIYRVHPEALNIIRNWSLEEKQNYIKDAKIIAMIASGTLK